MTPIICTDVERHKGLPLYTVKVYDIDHPVNFHSYDCLFFQQRFNLEELLKEAKEKIKEYETI
jgi:hypothetical protein